MAAYSSAPSATMRLPSTVSSRVELCSRPGILYAGPSKVSSVPSPLINRYHFCAAIQGLHGSKGTRNNPPEVHSKRLISRVTQKQHPSKSESKISIRKPVIQSTRKEFSQFSDVVSVESVSSLPGSSFVALSHFGKFLSAGPVLLAIPNLAGFNLEGPQSVLEAVGVLAAIITIHECGHFFAAYFQNIHITKFSIGFGPILLKLQGKKVEYSLRAIPLGGFVGFPDDDPESGFAPDDPDLLKNRPILDRLLVTSAGVAANLVFAYSILFGQVLTAGLLQREFIPGVLVPDVISSSVAASSGVLSGDVIVGVDGKLLSSGETAVFDLVCVIKENPNRTLSFLIYRNQEPVEVKIVPDTSVDGSGKIGVQLAPNSKAVKVKARDLKDATSRASKEFSRLFTTVTDGLKQVFFNFSQTAEKISGPVAIVAVGAEVARTDVAGLSQFAAIVNINLAVVNILPLPALDGGYILLILLEALRGGKKLPNKVEQGIMSSGILLLIGVGTFLMVRDAVNLGIELL